MYQLKNLTKSTLSVGSNIFLNPLEIITISDIDYLNSQGSIRLMENKGYLKAVYKAEPTKDNKEVDFPTSTPKKGRKSKSNKGD